MLLSSGLARRVPVRGALRVGLDVRSGHRERQSRPRRWLRPLNVLAMACWERSKSASPISAVDARSLSIIQPMKNFSASPICTSTLWSRASSARSPAAFCDAPDDSVADHPVEAFQRVVELLGRPRYGLPSGPGCSPQRGLWRALRSPPGRCPGADRRWWAPWRSPPDHWGQRMSSPSVHGPRSGLPLGGARLVAHPVPGEPDVEVADEVRGGTTGSVGSAGLVNPLVAAHRRSARTVVPRYAAASIGFSAPLATKHRPVRRCRGCPAARRTAGRPRPRCCRSSRSPVDRIALVAAGLRRALGERPSSRWTHDASQPSAAASSAARDHLGQAVGVIS